MSVCRSLVTSTTTSPRCLRLNLRVEMAKTQLARDLESVFKDLDGITTTKDQSSDTIRALIRDLHRSPVGPQGFAEAMQIFASAIARVPAPASPPMWSR
jgi:hypothetical protein